MENGPFIDDFPIKTSIYKGCEPFSMAINEYFTFHIFHLPPFIRAFIRVMLNNHGLPGDLPRNSFFVSAACGEKHTLLLCREGRVLAVGDDGYGQCQVWCAVWKFDHQKRDLIWMMWYYCLYIYIYVHINVDDIRYYWYLVGLYCWGWHF